MSDIGLKVIINGKQLTSQQTRDYSIWSKYSVMKTYRVITIGYTFAADVSSVILSIPHGLGYRPACWVSFTEASHIEWNNFDRWTYYYNSGGNKVLRFWQWAATLYDVQLQYTETVVAGGVDPTGESWAFKLYIFVDKLN